MVKGIRCFAEGAATVVMFCLLCGGLFLGGAQWERYTRPAPAVIEYCALPPGLQLSCSKQDRAEYEEVCRIRARSERIFQQQILQPKKARLG